MTNASPDMYVGRNAVDPQGDKIGSIGQVYLNDETGQPDWVTIHTGFFGMRESFAPLAGSTLNGDDLVLPFDKAIVKDAPDVADASHLDVDEQDRLWAYYQQYLGPGGGHNGVANEYQAGSGDPTYQATGQQNRPGQRDAGYDTAGPTTDAAMTRSEEQLKVGTERVETGRARLRKYVVTEQQTVQVPVQREEVRIEREPITDATRGDALAGADISEEEHEIVLTEERPVVTTEAVPVERVRLGTETVTETETVSGQVRKEQVELHDDTAARER